MRIPGFSAIASIYYLSNRYQVVTSLTEMPIRRELVPQFIRPDINCSPCIRGVQFCCPPFGIDMPCTYRSCWRPSPLPLG